MILKCRFSLFSNTSRRDKKEGRRRRGRWRRGRGRCSRNLRSRDK
jgi:hypothetical protein